MRASDRVIFLFLLAVFLGHQAASAFDYLGQCATIDESSPCRSYLSYDTFYLPSTSSQAEIQQNVTSVFSFLNLTNSECIKVGTVALCLNYYKPCIPVDLPSASVVLASFPCRSVCDQVMEACSDFVGFLDISCTQTESDGLDSFPVKSTIYDLSPYGGESLVSVECSDGSRGVVDNNATVSCPQPLVAVSDADKSSKSKYYFLTPSSNCALPCPFQFYTPSQERLMSIVKKVINSISFICVIFLLFTYFVVTNEITHRMELICYVSFSILLIIITYFFEVNTIAYQCTSDPGRYKVQSDGTCGIQGFLFQMGAVGSIFSVALVSVDLYLNSIMKSIPNFKVVRYVLWAVIVLFSVIPAAGSTYSSTIATHGCWIGDKYKSSFQYIFFFIPAWLSLITFLVFTLLFSKSIFTMYKISPNRNILIFNIKTLVFLVLLLFEFTFFSMFKHYIESEQDKYIKIIETWIRCLAENDESQCSLSIPGFPIRFLNTLCIALCGLIFFGFGFDLNVIKIYKESKRLKWALAKLRILSCAGDGVPNYLEDDTSTTRNISSSISMKNIK